MVPVSVSCVHGVVAVAAEVAVSVAAVHVVSVAAVELPVAAVNSDVDPVKYAVAVSICDGVVAANSNERQLIEVDFATYVMKKAQRMTIIFLVSFEQAYL